jgi:hypothetical protein
MAAVATPALLLAASNASASDRTGAIAGSVAAPADGVRVTAVATGTIGIRRTARPNRDGVYHIDHVPPGHYRLMFAAPGGRRWTVDHIVVHASQVTLTNSYDPPILMPMVTAGVPALPPSPPGAGGGTEHASFNPQSAAAISGSAFSR